LPEAGGAPRKPSIAERTGLTRRNAGLLAFGFAPLLLEFFANLWGRPHYQFFPMALAGAAFLAWSRLKEVTEPCEPGHGALTAALMGMSFCGVAAATALWSPWLASLAAVAGLAGVTWWVGGRERLRAVTPALVLLLTIIPPPLALDTQLMLYLQGLAARWSSRLLDTLGVIHLPSGNVIELPQQKLLVAEACSGINSVLFTLAAGLFYLMWQRRPVWRILVCLPCVVAGVLLGNVLRITLGGWLEFHRGIDILSGWRHEVAGMVLVVMYLALIASLDQLLEFLGQPLPETLAAPAPLEADSPPEETVRVRRQLTPRWGRVAGCAFALLGVAELGRGWLHHHQQKVEFRMASASGLRAGAAFTLPEQIGNWKRLSTAVPDHRIETQGIFSQIWHYQKGQTVASVALDYPFRGYHDVTVCYTLQGWHITRQQRQAGEGTNSSMALMAVDMNQEPVSHGSLWFSTVDEQGRWMERPVVAHKLLDRWNVTGRMEPVSYRVQALITGYSPPSPAERDAGRQLFEAARKLLAPQILGQMEGKL
jgi:exosortase